LLASFDTISSHFDTTFTALSTAFARCSSSSISATPQAHLAFLIGPSLTSAKAKIILGVDGLHLSIWGSRTSNPENEDGDSEDESEEEDHEDSEHENGDYEVPEDSEDDENDDENDDYEDEYDASDDELENEQDGSEERDEGDETDDHDEDVNSGIERIADTAGNAVAPQPALHRSYAEEQKFLQTADRLLSRTLAAADADGHGILSEMGLYLLSMVDYNFLTFLFSTYANTHLTPCPKKVQPPSVDT